jgi:ABC-type nitrate/sulfonate/bicarbonate transport system substrate-binding protein
MTRRESGQQYNRRELLQRTGYAMALTSALGGLAGCAGGAGGGSGSGSGSDGDSLETLRMAYSAPAAADDVSTWYGPRDIAPDEYSLETEIQVFEGIDLAIQSVLAGQADMARGSTTAASTIIETGKPFKMICSTAFNTDYVLVTSPEIESLQDIVDKDAVMGMSAPTGLDVVQTAAVMFNEGIIDSVDELNLQRVGFSSARQTALINGEIDVSPQHFDQWLAMKEEAPDLNMLLRFGDELDQWVQEVFMAPQDTIDNMPDELAALIKGLLVGHRNIYDQGFDLYLDLVRKYVPGGGPSEEALRTNFDYMTEINIWPPNGDLERSSVDAMLDIADKVGLTESRVATDDAMDRSILDRALEDIGTV